MNVACLKGIQKAAFVMPDAHEGYGFPIGGVAAFDVNEGIISPGGVGYDINCLTEDAEILSEFGFSKRIKDFEENFTEVDNPNSNYVLKTRKATISLISFDQETNALSAKEANFFMKKLHKGKVFNVHTRLGYSLKLTGEHPLLTQIGMVKAQELHQYQKVAVNPFQGISYQEPSDELLLDSTDFTPEQAQVLQKRDRHTERRDTRTETLWKHTEAHTHTETHTHTLKDTHTLRGSHAHSETEKTYTH